MKDPEPLTTIANATWALSTRMPNGLTPTSRCIILRDTSGLVVVDPGYPTEENWGTLLRALETISGEVVLIVATHMHADHLGLAERLRARTGAPLALTSLEADTMAAFADEPVAHTELEAWGVPLSLRAELLQVAETRRLAIRPVVPDLRLKDGEQLPLESRRIEVMLTPGHTPGHTCLLDAAQRLVLLGDHLIADSQPGIGLGGPSPTNPIADYLESLDRLRVLDGHVGAPGHGALIADIPARAAATRDHHLRRSRELAAVLDRMPDATIYELASQLTWSPGWEGLQGLSMYSALNQTRLHRDLVWAADSTAS